MSCQTTNVFVLCDSDCGGLLFKMQETDITDIYCRIKISKMIRKTLRTYPFFRSEQDTVLPFTDSSAHMTGLCRICRIDHNELFSALVAVPLQHIEKRSPSCIADRFCESVVSEKILYLQILRRDQVVAFDQLVCFDPLKVLSLS